MSFVQAKCPNCGGFLTVDNSKDAAVCQFCSAPFIVEKAINNYNITVNGNLSLEGATVNIEGAPSVANLIKRAEGCMQSGDYTKALEYYNRVLDIDPDSVEAATEIKKLTIPTQNNLFVQRIPCFYGAARKAYVYIDGNEIGSIGNLGSSSYMIPIGTHTVSVKLASFRSDNISFQLSTAQQMAKVMIKAVRQSVFVQVDTSIMTD